MSANEGKAPAQATEQPFFRVTIEVRYSPQEVWQQADERMRERVAEMLKAVRKFIDVSIETTEKKKPEDGGKAQRVKVE